MLENLMLKMVLKLKSTGFVVYNSTVKKISGVNLVKFTMLTNLARLSKSLVAIGENHNTSHT